MHADNYRFFLGGHDLEMLTIRELLSETVASEQIFDRSLSWGARVSAYQEEIFAVWEQGFVPVLIELEPDVPVPAASIIIDHHGERAGIDQPTSLEQIFGLLKLPQAMWTRHMSLVAANDRGHIAAMLELQASAEELAAIRAADRRAQGITETDERQARDAIQQLQITANGLLTVVTLPHSHSSAVTDFLDPALGGCGFKNLVVCTPISVNVFGCGHLIEHLRKAVPDCWYGGQLPVRGFWGSTTDADSVIRLAETYLKASACHMPTLDT